MISHSFHCTSLALLSLNLLLTLFFLMILSQGFSFVSILDSFFQVHKNTSESCTLILYSTTLWNSFIISNRSFMDSLRFSIYQFMSICMQIWLFLLFSFPTWMSYISLFCQISLARTSSIMLNRSGKNTHLSFFGNQKRNFQISPLHTTFTMGFSQIPLIKLRKFPSVTSFLSVFFFFCEWVVDYTKCFPASVEMIMGFLNFIL